MCVYVCVCRYLDVVGMGDDFGSIIDGRWRIFFVDLGGDMMG